MATLEKPVGRLERPLGRSSDEGLARRATRGDEQALGAIFERYGQELYRFCLGLLGEPQDAQDALQNTMVKALRALPGEKREIALRPWLYRIAHNEAINLRRAKRETQALDWQLLDGQSSVTERAEQRERLGWLFRDLSDLPPRQRAVLVMRELSGLDFADIGAALGTSGAVVRQSLYEARRNLGQMDRGRGLRCEAVMRVLSDADGRVSSRREIRAHLRDCPDCRGFQNRIEARKATFAGIAPLPLGAGMGLQSVLAGAGGSGASGVTAALGAGAASSAGTAGMVKAIATVAVVAIVGTATVGRSPHEPRSARDAPATSLSRRSHAAEAKPPGAKQDSSRATKPPAHDGLAATVPVATSATPATAVVPGKASAPAARDRAAKVPSLSSGRDFSVSASPAAGRSPASTKATPELVSSRGSEKPQPEKPNSVKKAEKQEEKAEARGQPERPGHPAHPVHPEHPSHPAHPQPAEPAATPEEAPGGAESTPASEAEESPETALHSPKGKAKGHEKQLSN